MAVALHVKRWIPVLVAALVSSVGPTAAGESEPLPLEIGPETTVLEGPLRDNGTVDYAAALNAKLGEGVTPEDNAFVVIAELMPLARWRVAEDVLAGEVLRQRVFEHLNVPVPDADSPTYASMELYAERMREQDDRWSEEVELEPPARQERLRGLGPQFETTRDRWRVEREQAWEGPWTAEQLPLVAEWMEAQRASLNRITEAMQRKTFWAPYVLGEDDTLVMALLPHATYSRQVTDGLRIRIHRRLEEDDIDGAVDDLLAMKQLSRHMSRQATSVEQLVAIGIAAMAIDATTSLASRDDFTAQQARSLLAELRRMEMRFPLARAIDTAERFLILDFLQQPDLFEQHGVARRPPERARERIAQVFDRNQAMRRINQIIDEVVEATRAETHSEQHERFAAIEERLNRRLDGPADWGALMELMQHADEAARRELATHAVVDMLLWPVFPGHERGMLSVDRLQVHERLEQTAVALAGYRAEHGSYPESLDKLVPDWLDAVPRDVFADDREPIRYLLEEDRVVIYSIGEDDEGDEDAGDGEDDGDTDGFSRDDIVIVLPRQKPERE